MSDLVERLRAHRIFLGPDWIGLDGDRNQTKWCDKADDLLVEAADALEAAQARIEAVRRETVEECARVADARWDAIVVPEARGGCDTAAAIRALTEAKEDRT